MPAPMAAMPIATEFQNPSTRRRSLPITIHLRIVELKFHLYRKIMSSGSQKSRRRIEGFVDYV